MKIGIDARWVFREISGIGLYTRELIRHLVILDNENNYVVFFDDDDLRTRTEKETGLDQAKNFSTCVLPFGLFSLKNQLRLPGILAEQRLNVFHSTNYMIPLLAFPRYRTRPHASSRLHLNRIQCVTTIHDLIPLIFPEYAPRSRKRRVFPIYRMLMHQIGIRSNIIITDSQCSRNDVLRQLRIPPEREDSVLAVYVGVSSLFRPLPAQNIIEKNTLKGQEHTQKSKGSKIILWVGRPDPYKNLVGLVEAFAKLRELYEFPTELRLAGSKDIRYPEAFRRAEALGVQNAISWLGYVSEEQLVAEYQHADVLVLPSLYEGFGLPVIEAMACGTPVICSNKGSLPEVAGNAALQVQPNDIIGLAESIKRVFTDPQMAGNMISRGLEHASKFTWMQTARQTLEAYWKALA